MDGVAAPISPELVLVCPELRAQALAALPERDPNAFLPLPRKPVPELRVLRVAEVYAPPADVVAPTAVVEAPPVQELEGPQSPGLLVAAACYFVICLVRSVAATSRPVALVILLAFGLAR